MQFSINIAIRCIFQSCKIIVETGILESRWSLGGRRKLARLCFGRASHPVPSLPWAPNRWHQKQNWKVRSYFLMYLFFYLSAIFKANSIDFKKSILHAYVLCIYLPFKANSKDSKKSILHMFFISMRSFPINSDTFSQFAACQLCPITETIFLIITCLIQ